MKELDFNGLLEFLEVSKIGEFCELTGIAPNTVTKLKSQTSDGKMYLETILKIQEAYPKKDLTPYFPVYSQIIENSQWKYKRKSPNKK
jgi:hypothetical protein